MTRKPRPTAACCAKAAIQPTSEASLARQKVANAPMSLIAPSANAEQAKNLAQNAVGQVFKLLP